MQDKKKTKDKSDRQRFSGRDSGDQSIEAVKKSQYGASYEDGMSLPGVTVFIEP